MVNAVKVKAGEYTPKIHLDLKENKFEISGKSLPEDINFFYEPIIQWLSMNLDQVKDGSEFVFKMTLINSSTSRVLNEIFNQLDECFRSGKDIKILWYYASYDEDMKDLGLEYQDGLSIPLKLVEVVVE